MPARREYTTEELAERLERQREQARVRMARLRARNASRNGTAVRVTNTVSGGVGDANPPIPPVLSISKEIESIRALLEPFADRGYLHSVKFWHLAAAEYPALRLELETEKLAEWLLEPRNLKAKCSKRRIANWLARAEVDRQQRQAEARQVPAPRGSYQVAGPPQPAPGRPPDPAPVLPDGETIQMVDRADAQRALFDAKKLKLSEKLALVKNGRQ